jgi:hypothetical protein
MIGMNEDRGVNWRSAIVHAGWFRPHDRKAHHDGADCAIITQSLPQENPNALDTSTD